MPKNANRSAADSELNLVEGQVQKMFPSVYRPPEEAPWRSELHESQSGRHIGDFYNGLPSRRANGKRIPIHNAMQVGMEFNRY